MHQLHVPVKRAPEISKSRGKPSEQTSRSFLKISKCSVKVGVMSGSNRWHPKIDACLLLSQPETHYVTSAMSASTDGTLPLASHCYFLESETHCSDPDRSSASTDETKTMLNQTPKLIGVWLKIKQEGLRLWSKFPLTRVPFWYRFFEPQPLGLFWVCSEVGPNQCPNRRRKLLEHGGQSPNGRTAGRLEVGGWKEGPGIRCSLLKISRLPMPRST